MTVKEANKQGWERNGYTAYQRGYVSRKNFDAESAEVYDAGGRLKGWKYYLAPTWNSTQFCLRVYLSKEEA